MHGSLARKAIAVIILLSQLAAAGTAFGQQRSEETRPRRTQLPANQAVTTTPTEDVWKKPTTETPISLSAELVSGPEPKIRVALATDTRSATVSTNGRLMNASDFGQNLVPLDVARVRLEPRLLSPPPPMNADNAYRVAVGGAASRDEAEQKSREIKDSIGEDSQITL
ncbi:MAG TPA: hypothetical protein VFD48_09935, partial [Pyrinomonadaceae bacterium]|nr:hypothetical protein [Pyrinomonadaceae bacterium]